MTFYLTVLGANSALPAAGRHPSAQIITIRDVPFLIDCGEGTQIQMNRFRIKRSKIDHVFISHLHGDHVLGLVPLLNSFALNRRKRNLHIYGPAPIQAFITHQMECTQSHLPYPIHFHELEAETTLPILNTGEVKVHAIALQHRLPTFGYIFRECQQPPHILPEELKKRGIPYSDIPKIKSGEEVQSESGEWIAPEELTRPSDPPRSFAYISDTRYLPELYKKIKKIDLLYHEATFLHELLDRAKETQHSTAREAAMVARDANAKQLIIGHYSTRYQNLDPLKEEARAIFENTLLAIEGNTYPVD
jgi:ribonuclease Z